jgi:hypothetical protein
MEDKIQWRDKHIAERRRVFLWGGTKPTRYCGHFWHIVQAPDDKWRWLWSNWWNEDWQGKPKYSEKTCPSANLSTTFHTWPDPGSNPGRRGGKPATNRLSYGAAIGEELVRFTKSQRIRWLGNVERMKDNTMPKWMLKGRLYSHQYPICIPLLPHSCYMPCQPHPPWLGEECKLWSSSLCSFLQPPVTSSLFGSNILLNTLFSNTLSLCQRPSFTPIQNQNLQYLT